MIAPEGTFLLFRCRLLSPFHTTRQEYAGLWKCAPFVLGSTLRGALLSHLVTTHYDDAAIQAGTYQTEGIVAPFFASPPRIYFSFGHFLDEVGRGLEAHTRIAIEREHGSVAEGALLSVEAVSAGTEFTFEVLLSYDDGALARLVEEGLDGIEVSGGVLDSGDLGPTRGPDAEEGYFLEEAAAFAGRLSVPVGTVGGIRTLDAVERILDRGLAFASLSRPLIREPDLPKAWREGEKRTAECVSCNRCFVPALRGKGIRCMGPRRRKTG